MTFIAIALRNASRRNCVLILAVRKATQKEQRSLPCDKSRYLLAQNKASLTIEGQGAGRGRALYLDYARIMRASQDHTSALSFSRFHRGPVDCEH